MRFLRPARLLSFMIILAAGTNVASSQVAPVAPPVAYLGDARIAPAIACAALTKSSTPLVAIEQARAQPAAPFALGGPAGATSIALPAHCFVTGVIEKRIGVGGKPYGIRFELRLPTTWNGRFLFQGGGGINGVVTPALGTTKGPSALVRGFAVVTQDAGHEGRDASFGEDQQARIDMIYRSYERVTVEAKRLVAAYYGRAADHNYFMGCSEGGREALLVSQRMPTQYDGVVAGDPGFLLGVSFDDVAGRMAVARMAPRGSDGLPDFAKAFSQAQLAMLTRFVMDECDDNDGLKDNIVDNPVACRPRLDRIACAPGKDGTDNCLTAQQVRGLREIFDGGLPAGHNVTTRGYYWNTALATPMWRDKLAGFGGLKTLPVSSIQGLFLTPYQPSFDETSIDFAKDGARFDEVGNLYRADGVAYSTFAQRGARLLIYTGLADPAFSARTLAAYYERLLAANGGDEAVGFARMFLVPGMTHCRGGPSLDEFDPLGAVVAWVEHGSAPERLIATGTSFPGRSRPICRYPLQSRYRGGGSIEDADNFDCRGASVLEQ